MGIGSFVAQVLGYGSHLGGLSMVPGFSLGKGDNLMEAVTSSISFRPEGHTLSLLGMVIWLQSLLHWLCIHCSMYSPCAVQSLSLERYQKILSLLNTERSLVKSCPIKYNGLRCHFCLVRRPLGHYPSLTMCVHNQ